MAINLNFENIVTSGQIKREITPSLVKELREYFLYFLKIFLLIALFYVLIRSSVFDLIAVSGKSMYPNYNLGNTEDAIYIDQLTPRFSDYRRGDVVVLLAPTDCDAKRSLYIKRIVGLPGEQVAFDKGNVYIINDSFPDPGVLLEEGQYLPQEVKTYYRNNQDENQRVISSKIKDDEYFFMGDNRPVSSDSRYCGPIKKSQIIGREIYRLTPVDKRSWFSLPKYSIGN